MFSQVYKKEARPARGGERERGHQQMNKEFQKQDANDKKLVQIMEKFSYSKPTNVDAQRIVTILDNLITKTEILQYLDSEFLNSLLDKQKKGELDNIM